MSRCSPSLLIETSVKVNGESLDCLVIACSDLCSACKFIHCKTFNQSTSAYRPYITAIVAFEMEADESEEASYKLLTSYELLENILSHLPTKDLVRSQRVCRAWKDVTMRSQLLRKHLFLMPDICEAVDVPWTSGRSYSPPDFMKLHPIISEDSFFFYSYRSSYNDWSVLLNMFDVKHLLEWTDRRWTAMLITQPPSKPALVTLYAATRGPRVYEKRFKDSGGIRIGVMMEAMMVMSEYFEEQATDEDLVRSPWLLRVRGGFADDEYAR